MHISMHLTNGLRPHVLMLLYVLILVGCTVSQGTVGPGQAPSVDPEESMAPEMTLETGIDRLARGILESLSSGERLKIAVVDLLGPNDSHTEFGSFVSEKLITKLFVSDDRSITVGLIAKRATLTLRIDPSDGEIVFDGETQGRASQGVMVLREVPPGKHTVRVSAEGYLPETREIEVYEDKVISIKLPSDPLTKIANLKQDKPSFNIEIWTDKKRYRIGEEIRFQFRSDQDCYLTLIDYDTNGSVKVLFPNRYSQNGLIEAGKTYTIPGNEYGFKLIIEPPTGIEKVKAIATTKPLSFFEMDFTEDIFPRVERSNTRSMRGIRVAMESLLDMIWAENTCTISIR